MRAIFSWALGTTPSESLPVLGVRDFRGRSVGPTFKADLRKSLLSQRVPLGCELDEELFVGDSDLGGAGGLLSRFSEEDWREFKRTTLTGESLDFGMAFFKGLLLLLELSSFLASLVVELDFVEVVEIGLYLKLLGV